MTPDGEDFSFSVQQATITSGNITVLESETCGLTVTVTVWPNRGLLPSILGLQIECVGGCQDNPTVVPSFIGPQRPQHQIQMHVQLSTLYHVQQIAWLCCCLSVRESSISFACIDAGCKAGLLMMQGKG